MTRDPEAPIPCQKVVTLNHEGKAKFAQLWYYWRKLQAGHDVSWWFSSTEAFHLALLFLPRVCTWQCGQVYDQVLQHRRAVTEAFESLLQHYQLDTYELESLAQKAVQSQPHFIPVYAVPIPEDVKEKQELHDLVKKIAQRNLSPALLEKLTQYAKYLRPFFLPLRMREGFLVTGDIISLSGELMLVERVEGAEIYVQDQHGTRMLPIQEMADVLVFSHKYYRLFRYYQDELFPRIKDIVDEVASARSQQEAGEISFDLSRVDFLLRELIVFFHQQGPSVFLDINDPMWVRFLSIFYPRGHPEVLGHLGPRVKPEDAPGSRRPYTTPGESRIGFVQEIHDMQQALGCVEQDARFHYQTCSVRIEHEDFQEHWLYLCHKKFGPGTEYEYEVSGVHPSCPHIGFVRVRLKGMSAYILYRVNFLSQETRVVGRSASSRLRGYSSADGGYVILDNGVYHSGSGSEDKLQFFGFEGTPLGEPLYGYSIPDVQMLRSGGFLCTIKEPTGIEGIRIGGQDERNSGEIIHLDVYGALDYERIELSSGHFFIRYKTVEGKHFTRFYDPDACQVGPDYEGEVFIEKVFSQTDKPDVVVFKDIGLVQQYDAYGKFHGEYLPIPVGHKITKVEIGKNSEGTVFSVKYKTKGPNGAEQSGVCNLNEHGMFQKNKGGSVELVKEADHVVIKADIHKEVIRQNSAASVAEAANVARSKYTSVVKQLLPGPGAMRLISVVPQDSGEASMGIKVHMNGMAEDGTLACMSYGVDFETGTVTEVTSDELAKDAPEDKGPMIGNVGKGWRLWNKDPFTSPDGGSWIAVYKHSESRKWSAHLYTLKKKKFRKGEKWVRKKLAESYEPLEALFLPDGRFVMAVCRKKKIHRRWYFITELVLYDAKGRILQTDSGPLYSMSIKIIPLPGGRRFLAQWSAEEELYVYNVWDLLQRTLLCKYTSILFKKVVPLTNGTFLTFDDKASMVCRLYRHSGISVECQFVRDRAVSLGHCSFYPLPEGGFLYVGNSATDPDTSSVEIALYDDQVQRIGSAMHINVVGKVEVYPLSLGGFSLVANLREGKGDVTRVIMVPSPTKPDEAPMAVDIACKGKFLSVLPSPIDAIALSAVPLNKDFDMRFTLLAGKAKDGDILSYQQPNLAAYEEVKQMEHKVVEGESIDSAPEGEVRDGDDVRSLGRVRYIRKKDAQGKGHLFLNIDGFEMPVYDEKTIWGHVPNSESSKRHTLQNTGIRYVSRKRRLKSARSSGGRAIR